MGNLSSHFTGYPGGPTKQLELIPTGSRTPAPEPLRLVQQFVNTADIYSQQEDLPDPAALKKWLVERRLLLGDAKVRERDHQRAIEVREALRQLLGTHSGYETPKAANEVLNAASQRASLSVHFEEAGSSRLSSGATGVDSALGQILSAAHSAMINGTWERLKVCRDDRCMWAFYDQSKNRSSRWCSMAVCGNRVKARKHRQKSKA